MKYCSEGRGSTGGVARRPLPPGSGRTRGAAPRALPCLTTVEAIGRLQITSCRCGDPDTVTSEPPALSGALIYQHQTVLVVRVGLLSKGLNRKTIIPDRLVHINPTAFHGRSGFPRRRARFPIKRPTFLALPTRSRQKKKDFVVLILEHLSFQFDEPVQIFLVPFSQSFRARHFDMKQNRPLITIKDSPGLVRCRSMRRTTMACAVPRAPELAF